MGYYKNIQNNGPASAGSETEAHFMKQNRTRMALADAYLRLLNDYTIDRITVKMITDAVGCSRKTFYYYFTDVYVLTQYVFELRVQHFLNTNGNFETMREGFLTLASNLSNDRQAILNTARKSWSASRGRRAITMPVRSSRATRRTWTSPPRISRQSSVCIRT